MGAIVIRTRYDEGTESAEVATSELFDLRAVCRGNNELFLVPWNKTLKYLNYFLLGFYRSVCRDVMGLRIYLFGWQEMENFHCLSLKTQL